LNTPYPHDKAQHQNAAYWLLALSDSVSTSGPCLFRKRMGARQHCRPRSIPPIVDR